MNPVQNKGCLVSCVLIKETPLWLFAQLISWVTCVPTASCQWAKVSRSHDPTPLCSSRYDTVLTLWRLDLPVMSVVLALTASS